MFSIFQTTVREVPLAHTFCQNKFLNFQKFRKFWCWACKKMHYTKIKLPEKYYIAQGESTLLFTLSRDFPYTPAPAIIMAGMVLAITRQLLELGSCSNSLRIRDVFQFPLKMLFSFGFGVLRGWCHKRGCFAFFRFVGQLYLALGANPMNHFWLIFVLESMLSSEYVEHLQRKLWLKN